MEDCEVDITIITIVFSIFSEFPKQLLLPPFAEDYIPTILGTFIEC